MRIAIRWIAVLALLAMPLSLAAQLNPVWTALPSTGAVDESNYAPVNFSFSGPALGFLGASIGPSIVARYNVTNLGGNSNPLWTALQLGAIDNSGAAGNQVSATLFRVSPCTGAQAIICTTTSVTNGTGVCTRCLFPANTFDFTQFLYYVEVKVSRTASTVSEQALTLQIF
jgi:hypothetical protein